MQKLFFISLKKYGRWSREWKRSILIAWLETNEQMLMKQILYWNKDRLNMLSKFRDHSLFIKMGWSLLFLPRGK